MEVLFITHKYPPSIGGMEKQSYKLIKGISGMCKTHTLIYNAEAESRVHFFLNLKKKVDAIIRKNPNIDLIHVNDGLMAAFTTWLPAKYHIPVVATFHGLDVVFPLAYYQNKIVPRYNNLAGCISVSNATAEALYSRGIPKNKVYKINNGVDHELSKLQIKNSFIKKLESEVGIKLDDKKILVTMGRPVRRKGFTWFLKNVMPSLAEDVILLMIGPMEMKKSLKEKTWNQVPLRLRTKIELLLGLTSDQAELRELLNNNTYSKRVFHLGQLPFPDVLQTLSIADLFIMPNIRVDGDAEGFGLVALESSIRQTPVLAADIDGIPDAVHDGKNGWLIKSGDQEAWIYKIYQLFNDISGLKDFGKKAQQHTLANFDWDIMCAEYHNVFKSILKNKKSGDHLLKLESKSNYSKFNQLQTTSMEL